MKFLFAAWTMASLVIVAFARDMDEYGAMCYILLNNPYVITYPYDTYPYDMNGWLSLCFNDNDVCGPSLDFQASRSCMSVASGQWCAGSGWAILRNNEIKCCREPPRFCQNALSYCSTGFGGGGGGGDGGGGGSYLVRPTHDPTTLYSC